jgi:hypothetical protein
MEASLAASKGALADPGEPLNSWQERTARCFWTNGALYGLLKWFCQNVGLCAHSVDFMGHMTARGSSWTALRRKLILILQSGGRTELWNRVFHGAVEAGIHLFPELEILVEPMEEADVGGTDRRAQEWAVQPSKWRSLCCRVACHLLACLSAFCCHIVVFLGFSSSPRP